MSISSSLCHFSILDGPVESAIKKKLVEAFKPVHLQIINESFMHNVPPGSETHFKVLVVSPTFENVPLIKVCSPVFSSLQRNRLAFCGANHKGSLGNEIGSNFTVFFDVHIV